MNLIKEFNDKTIHNSQVLHEELINYDENCLIILESDSHLICDSAICFLTKLADDLKKGRITNHDKKFKNRLSIFTVLELLRVKQPIPPDALDVPSVRKYLDHVGEFEPGELDDVQKMLLGILSKLQDTHHEKGSHVRDAHIDLFNDDPNQLLTKVNKLKAKYKIIKQKL